MEVKNEMRKGQIGTATALVALLALAVVGIAIVNDMVTPYCQTGTKACENFEGTNTTYTPLFHSSIYENTETVYNTTGCNGSTINQANYTMNYTDGGIILASDDGGWSGWDQSITYQYYAFGHGIFGGILATIICYLPILFAVGVLAMIAYVAFKW